MKASRTAVLRDLPCPGGMRTFRFFDTEIGHTVARQVLGGQSYPLLPWLSGVRTIVDVGANVGAAAVCFSLRYPDARVLAFEPDPDCFELLGENTSDLPRIESFNAGLSDRDREAALFLGTVDPATNSLGVSALNAQSSVNVRLLHAGKALHDAGAGSIDILKLDTEGSELPILRTLAPALDNIRAIYFEYHDDRARREIDALLAPTHILVQGAVHFAHRGELCYVRQSDVPGVDRLRIEMPGE